MLKKKSKIQVSAILLGVGACLSASTLIFNTTSCAIVDNTKEVHLSFNNYEDFIKFIASDKYDNLISKKAARDFSNDSKATIGRYMYENITAGDMTAYLCSSIQMLIGIQEFIDEITFGEVTDPIDGVRNLKIDVHKDVQKTTPVVAAVMSWTNIDTSDTFEIRYVHNPTHPTWDSTAFFEVINIDDIPFEPFKDIDWPIITRLFADVGYDTYWECTFPDDWVAVGLMDDLLWGSIAQWQLQKICPNWVFPEN